MLIFESGSTALGGANLNAKDLPRYHGQPSGILHDVCGRDVFCLGNSAVSRNESKLVQQMNSLSDLVAALQGMDTNRSESVPVFEALLADVVVLRSPECIVPLLGLFRDDAQHDEMMFSLVHSLEVFDDPTYVEHVLLGAASFCEQSPRWASILFMRMLNSESTRQELVKQLRSAPVEAKSAIKGLMEKINARGVQFLPKTTAVVVAAS